MALDVIPIQNYLSQFNDLEEKIRQNMLNRKFSEQERQTSLNRNEMINQFYPLDQAIKAQNSLSYSNQRDNPSSDYLKAISNMPSKQRELYLSYPENAERYQKMVDMASNKMDAGKQNNSLINREMLNSLFQQNIPMQSQNMMSQQPQIQSQNSFVSPSYIPMQQAQQYQQAQQSQQAQQYQQDQQNEYNQNYYQPTELQNQEYGLSKNEAQQKQNINNIPSSLYEAKESLPQVKSIPIQWAKQKQQNDSNVGQSIKDRRDGAVAVDFWLMNNREKIQNSLKSASKYSSYWGLGEKKKDEFLSGLMNKDPQGYKDLIWYEKSFIPNMDNAVKVMEKLSSTNEQRKEMTEMFNSLINPKLNKKQAIDVFNKQIGTIFDISDSVIKTSEPIHQGIIRNIYNIPKFEGDYIRDEDKELGIKKPKRTYSQMLDEPISDLIKNGSLEKKSFIEMTPEQRSAILRKMRKS